MPRPVRARLLEGLASYLYHRLLPTLTQVGRVVEKDPGLYSLVKGVQAEVRKVYHEIQLVLERDKLSPQSLQKLHSHFQEVIKDLENLSSAVSKFASTRQILAGIPEELQEEEARLAEISRFGAAFKERLGEIAERAVPVAERGVESALGVLASPLYATLAPLGLGGIFARTTLGPRARPSFLSRLWPFGRGEERREELERVRLSAAATQPLFEFFNKRAFEARWTKQVLDLLGKIAEARRIGAPEETRGVFASTPIGRALERGKQLFEGLGKSVAAASSLFVTIGSKLIDFLRKLDTGIPLLNNTVGRLALIGAILAGLYYDYVKIKQIWDTLVEKARVEHEREEVGREYRRKADIQEKEIRTEYVKLTLSGKTPTQAKEIIARERGFPSWEAMVSKLEKRRLWISGIDLSKTLKTDLTAEYGPPARLTEEEIKRLQQFPAMPIPGRLGDIGLERKPIPSVIEQPRKIKLPEPTIRPPILEEEIKKSVATQKEMIAILKDMNTTLKKTSEKTHIPYTPTGPKNPYNSLDPFIGGLVNGQLQLGE